MRRAFDCPRDRACSPCSSRELPSTIQSGESLPPLAESYVKLVPQELGAPNVITGILLTYRAFDTLGEVAVLFMVAAGVGLVLAANASRVGHLGGGHRRP